MHENIVYDVTREPASGGLMLLAFFGLLGLFIGGGALLGSRAGASSRATSNAVACVGLFFLLSPSCLSLWDLATGRLAPMRCVLASSELQ